MHTKSSESKGDMGKGAICGLVLLGALLITLAGCAAIPIHEQGLAARSNMQFSEDDGSALQSALVSQVEPGTGIGNGGQAAGCVACR